MEVIKEITLRTLAGDSAALAKNLHPAPELIPVKFHDNKAPVQTAGAVQGQTEKKKSPAATLALAAVFVLIVLAAVGYFMLPKFIAKFMAAPAAQIPENSTSALETTETQTIEPQPDQSIASADSTQTSQPETSTSNSLLTKEPVGKSQTTLTVPLTVESWKVGLQDGLPAAGTSEVNLFKEGHIQISFSELIGTLIPTLKPQTETLFAGEYSTLVFVNSSGRWPGVVAKLKDDVTAESIQPWFDALEKSPNNKNFFITNPGALQPFRDGIIGDIYPNRFAPGTTAGASFSYLILPDKKLVLIGTSFEGMKDALRLLQ